MPDKSEVIHKIILSAIVILGVTIGHAIAAARFHIPGIYTYPENTIVFRTEQFTIKTLSSKAGTILIRP